MRRDRTHLIAGVALLCAGAFWLLASFDLLGKRLLGAMVTALVLGGVAFLAYLAYRRDPATQWGWLIPVGLLSAVALIAAGEILGILPDPLAPLLFFAGIAAAFLRIHALDHRRSWAAVAAWISLVVGFSAGVGSWGAFGHDLAGAIFLWGSGAAFIWHFLRTGRDWALLPAGFLITAGVAPVIGGHGRLDDLAPAVLLFGFAATFAAYYLLGRPGSGGWARFAALASFVLGLLALVVGIARPLVVYGIPIAFILAGLYLLLRDRGDGDAITPTPAG